ncbi:hypothetical protein Emed_003656 [Eimeria media]
MNNEAFNPSVSNLTTLSAATLATGNVDTTEAAAALTSGAFAPAIGSARLDAADNDELNTSTAALALQRSLHTAEIPGILLHQHARGSFASYQLDAPILQRSLFPYDAAASRAPDDGDGACSVQHNQQQQHQVHNHFVESDSAAAYHGANEKSFESFLSSESAQFCDGWAPPREVLEQQQLRLESLQQTLDYCDERCTLGRSFRAREAAVRARLLHDQLQKQQQAQRLRQQRNAKLMEEAVSSTSQKLMAPPPYATQRLALCLTELHKQMQQQLGPTTFAAATKSGPGRTATGEKLTSKSGQRMSVLYETAEDLAEAEKSIKTRASILLSQQEGAKYNNVHSSLLGGSAVQAHMALQRAKGSFDTSKFATEATASEFGCATRCSSPLIPEEMSITCTKTRLPPASPQKFISYSEKLCFSSSSRHKSAGVPRKTSSSTNDRARKESATKYASEDHRLLKLNHRASTLERFPLQLHDAQQVRLRQQQRSRRHHNIRQSLQSFPEGESPEKSLACATPAEETNRGLTTSHAAKVGLDNQPSESRRKEEHHRKHHRRHKPHFEKNEGQLHEQKTHHLVKPSLTQQGSSPGPQDNGAHTFSSRSSSRSLASRATSPTKGIHYLRGGANVSEPPTVHSIIRGAHLHQNTNSPSTSGNAHLTAKSSIGRVPLIAEAVAVPDRDNVNSRDNTPVLNEKQPRHYAASCHTSQAEPPAARSSAAHGDQAHSSKEPLHRKPLTPEAQPMSTQTIGGNTSAESKRESLKTTSHNGTLAKGHSSMNDLVRLLMDVKQDGTG